MKCKHIRLIMELIFIFILPLVFMCFSSEIQIERNFEYDNNGNYETSQETKQLSFDNSIIKYTKTLFNNKSFNNLLETNYINSQLGNFYYKWDYKRLPEIIYINNDYNYNDPIIELKLSSQSASIGIYYLSIYLDDDLFIKYDRENSDNNDYVETIGSYLGNEIINNVEYCKFRLLNKEFTYNFYQQLSYFINEDNYYYYETINTIWGNIKQIIIDYLDVNDNVLLDILLCYLFIWFFHFLIWHTFYRFFDWIFHLNLAWGKDNE